ncbi:MAG: sulfotransferase, partial [Mycobacterium sp.]
MSQATEVLEFDDLTAPRLTDIQRQILDHTESRTVDLDVEQMLDEAVRLAGADDLDNGDGVTTRIAAYV